MRYVCLLGCCIGVTTLFTYLSAGTIVFFINGTDTDGPDALRFTLPSAYFEPLSNGSVQLAKHINYEVCCHKWWQLLHIFYFHQEQFSQFSMAQLMLVVALWLLLLYINEIVLSLLSYIRHTCTCIYIYAELYCCITETYWHYGMFDRLHQWYDLC